MGSEVNPLPGRGAPQPDRGERRRGGRRGQRSVQADGPAAVPGRPADGRGPDVGAADGHRRLPLQLRARTPRVTHPHVIVFHPAPSSVGGKTQKPADGEIPPGLSDATLSNNICLAAAAAVERRKAAPDVRRRSPASAAVGDDVQRGDAAPLPLRSPLSQGRQIST